jgi:DNA-directed RNA polymerase subunit RPC12/RpoP
MAQAADSAYPRPITGDNNDHNAGGGGSIMATVMMTCAGCGKEIDTRIEMDQTTFDQLPQIETEMVCPKCGAKNFWDKSRARLDGAPPDASAA